MIFKKDGGKASQVLGVGSMRRKPWLLPFARPGCGLQYRLRAIYESTEPRGQPNRQSFEKGILADKSW